MGGKVKEEYNAEKWSNFCFKKSHSTLYNIIYLVELLFEYMLISTN